MNRRELSKAMRRVLWGSTARRSVGCSLAPAGPNHLCGHRDPGIRAAVAVTRGAVGGLESSFGRWCGFVVEVADVEMGALG